LGGGKGKAKLMRRALLVGEKKEGGRGSSTFRESKGKKTTNDGGNLQGRGKKEGKKGAPRDSKKGERETPGVPGEKGGGQTCRGLRTLVKKTEPNYWKRNVYWGKKKPSTLKEEDPLNQKD